MRQIKLNVYDLEELSEVAQEKAHYDFTIDCDYGWGKENEETLREFEKTFPVKITDWAYGLAHRRIKFYFEASEDIENLSGIRLLAYLWNNYKRDLFPGKYIGRMSKPCFHKRTKNEKLSNGKTFTTYHSKILLDTCCPLTGYHMDNNILQPIYDFMNYPEKNINFYNLMQNCLEEYISACAEDMESFYSWESFKDMAGINGWEFYEDGTMVHSWETFKDITEINE